MHPFPIVAVLGAKKSYLATIIVLLSQVWWGIIDPIRCVIDKLLWPSCLFIIVLIIAIFTRFLLQLCYLAYVCSYSFKQSRSAFCIIYYLAEKLAWKWLRDQLPLPIDLDAARSHIHRILFWRVQLVMFLYITKFYTVNPNLLKSNKWQTVLRLLEIQWIVVDVFSVLSI